MLLLFVGYNFLKKVCVGVYVCPVFAGLIVRRSPMCVCLSVCVSMDLFFWDVEGGMYMFGCCTCLTQIFFSLFRARSAAYSSNTLQIQYTSCVCVCGFSVNFNVDMYLVLRSPISRR